MCVYEREKIMRDRQNRYSIRKLTVGAASVLIGFAFIGGSKTADAATVSKTQDIQNQITLTKDTSKDTSQETKTGINVVNAKDVAAATQDATTDKAKISVPAEKQTKNTASTAKAELAKKNTNVTKKASATIAPTNFAAINNISDAQATLAQVAPQPTSANNTQADNGYVTVNNFNDFLNAVNSSAAGVNITGNIVGTQNVTINRNFTINGINNATLSFGTNTIAIGSNETFKLSNLNIVSENAAGLIKSANDNNIIIFDNVTNKKNSLFNGKGHVYIQGHVTTVVNNDSQSGNAALQGFGNVNQTVSGSGLGGAGNPGATSAYSLQSTNGAIIGQVNNRKVPNIYASNLTIDANATLTVKRTVTGDGIVLRDGAVTDAGIKSITTATSNGNLHIGANGSLNIDLKGSDMTPAQIKAMTSGIDTTNAAVRVNTSGSFTSDENAHININVGAGRGIVFSERDTGINTNNNDNYISRGDPGMSGTNDPGNPMMTNWINNNPAIKNTFKLGDNNQLTFVGRDAFMLGNRANFNSGKGSTVLVHTYGQGNAIDMGQLSTLTIDPSSTVSFYSDGKKDSAGDYNQNNYIALGGGGDIEVLKDATLRVILTNRGTSGLNDDINISSYDPNLSPRVYVGNNATLDVQSDATNGNAELISIPLPASKSANFILDNVKYVNLQRTAKTTATALAPDMPAAMHQAFAKLGIPASANGYGNLIFLNSGKPNNAHFEAYGDIAVFKWNNENLTNGLDFDPTKTVSQNFSTFEKSANQTWKNMYGFDIPYAGFTNVSPNTNSVWVDPSGSTDGTNVNSEQGTTFSNVVNGFSPYMSQRLVVIGHSIQPVENQRTVHYVVQDVDENGNPIETDPSQMREVAKAYVQSAQGDNAQSQELYKDNATDQLVKIERNADGTPKLDANGAVIPVRDASGNYETDGNTVNWNSNKGNIVKAADGHYYFEGYQAPAKITGKDSLGQTVESIDGKVYRLATDSELSSITNNSDVVANGSISDSKEFANNSSDFQNGNYYNTTKDGNLYVVYRLVPGDKNKTPFIAQGIENVTISREISRNIAYKDATNSKTNFDENLNNDDAQRQAAKGLNDMNPDSLKGTTNIKQTITIIGTGYLDKNTGKFIQADADGHPIDAQGRLVTYDDQGNVVVGQLVNDKIVPLVVNGQTTPSSFVDGKIKWGLKEIDPDNLSDPAKGWDSPTADGYTDVPDKVTDFDGNTKVQFNDPDVNGEPTVQQVIDYLNNHENSQTALATDIITDDPNYPKMGNIVPSSQYIFDQFQVTDDAYNTKYILTLSVDRSNPTGTVYMYVTSPDYNRVWKNSVPLNGTINSPYYINVINNSGDKGNSVSVYTSTGSGLLLKRIFGYGAKDSDASYSPTWGDFKPHKITQVIRYVDSKSGQDIMNEIKTQGLTGQHFDASGVDKVTIPGYKLDNTGDITGSISDYQVGKTYTRTWLDNAFTNPQNVTETFTVLNEDGDVSASVKVTDAKTGNLSYNFEPQVIKFNKYGIFYLDPSHPDPDNALNIQNPVVKSTATVVLKYDQDAIKGDTYYVAYTQKGSVKVNFYDDTTDSFISGVGYDSGKEKADTPITYTSEKDLGSLEAKGYVYVKTEGTIPSTITGGKDVTVTIHVKHGVQPVTPTTPPTDVPSNTPDNAQPAKLTKEVTLNVTYVNSDRSKFTGTVPANAKQTVKFTGTAYVDKVTGELVNAVQSKQQDGKINWVVDSDNSATPEIAWKPESGSFNKVVSPFEKNYHIVKVSDHQDGNDVATITDITKDSKNIDVIVTYEPNGHIVPKDPDGNPIPNAPEPQYPTDPKNPSGVVPDEPVPDIPGYTPEVPTVTPKDPGKDTPVIYTRNKDQQAKVNYVDQDKHDALITSSPILSGKAGTKINYSTADTIKDLENKGYVLVSDGFKDAVDNNSAIYDNDDNTVQTYQVVLKHGTETLTPDEPGKPGEPINPNDPDPKGPKYPADTDAKHLKVTGKQTIHYVGAGDKTPKDDVQSFGFTKKVVIDKVTGDIIDKGQWSDTSHTFGMKDSPVIDGYHVDLRSAGGLTVTPYDLTKEVTVTYKPNGKIVPVLPDPKDPTKPGKPIPGAETPQYPTNPDDPKGVVPDEPVPNIPGYTPSTPTVTPTDPGTDTPVIYTPTPTPTPAVKQGSLTVIYRDDTTGEDIPNVTYNSGKEDVGTKVTYTTTDIIKNLESQGYKYKETEGTIPSEISEGSVTVIVHMTKPSQPTEPTNPTPEVKQGSVKVVFHDDTNKVDINEPGIGYDSGKVNEGAKVTYDRNEVNQDLATLSTQGYEYVNTDGTIPATVGDTDVLVTVHVKKATPSTPEPVKQGSVKVVFHDDTTGKDIPDYGYNSDEKPDGTPVSYTTTDDKTKLENQGYVFDHQDGTIPSSITGGKDVTITVHMKHGTQPVDPEHPGNPGNPINPGTPDKPINPAQPNGPKWPNGTKKVDLEKDVTRTIKFVDENGNTVATSVTQTVHFTESGVIDKVTGKWITPLTWSSDQSVAEVKVPEVINGYKVKSIDKDYTDLTKVDSVTLKHGDSDYTVTVTYAKDENPSTPNKPVVPPTTTTPTPTPEPSPKPQPEPNPSTPENPTTPEVPETPAPAPKPETPVVPETPAPKPEAPVRPVENISTPVKAAEAPKVEAKAQKATLPQTGESSNEAATAAGLFTGLLGLLGLVEVDKKKRRKH